MLGYRCVILNDAKVIECCVCPASFACCVAACAACVARVIHAKIMILLYMLQILPVLLDFRIVFY